MDQEALWAPWRLGYIRGEERPPRETLELPDGADPDCFVCRAAASERDRENLLVHRGKLACTVLNRYPYNNGHLLVAPRRHQGALTELTPDEHHEIMTTISRWTDVLAHVVNAEGFNVGLNLGRVAGAGLPGHLHWHIVPRWSGDVNFMPTLAGIKVIPQSLDAVWEALSTAFNTEV